MKIVFLDQSHLRKDGESFDFSALEKLGQFSLHDVRDHEDIMRVAADAEIVITGKCRLDRELLSRLRKTRLVLKAGTSCDKIDVAAARESDITVCNLPGHAEIPVAQNTFALLLSLAGSILPYDTAVKRNLWAECQYSFPSVCLSGKTLGIIGFGAIGRRVAALAEAFGMRILVHTRFPLPSPTVTYVRLREIAVESDFVSLHCMLSEKTKNLVNRDFLHQMKSTAYLINTARAGLVDEADLLRALNDRTIAGAAFDGFWQEPAPKDHPLFLQENFLITPHVAWAARETRQEMIESIAHTIASFQLGNPCNEVVPDH